MNNTTLVVYTVDICKIIIIYLLHIHGFRQ